MREVRLRAEDVDVDITIPMGDGVAVLTGGYGGYEPVDRQDGIAVTDWSGQAPISQDVPLMLDGGRQKRSVEGQLAQVRRLGRDPDGGPPPVFRAWGPIHLEGKRWVLPSNGIEFSTDEEECKRRNDGELYRQAFTLHLLEYVDPDTIRLRHRRSKSKRGAPARTGGTAYPGSTYTVQKGPSGKGETAVEIAAKLYGDWRECKGLARENDIADPRKPLKVGRVLRLP